MRCSPTPTRSGRSQRAVSGGEGEGEVDWEIMIDIYTVPWVRQTVSGNLQDSRGSSAQCSLKT